MEERKTVAYYMERLVDVYGSRTALIFRKEFRREEWSYEELHNLAHRIAGFYEEQRYEKGDKVLLYSYNSPEWGAILLACALTGVIAVPIDHNAEPSFALQIAKKVKAKAAFVSRYKQIEGMKNHLIEDLFYHVEKHHAYRSAIKIDEDDILEIVYTSGTTSEPKGVIITNRNLVSNIRSMRLGVPLNSDLRLLSIIPQSHLFEQTVGFFCPLRFGCSITYVPSRRSSVLLKAMQEERINTIIAVPMLLTIMRDRIERQAREQGKARKLKRARKWALTKPIWIRRIMFRKILRRFGDLRYFITGGAPLDIDLEQFWNSIGITVVQGYGLTETSPIMTCNTLEKQKVGTVGTVLPNQEIKIVDGEILCRGENITEGYYKNPKTTRETFHRGWYKTGDLGDIDEEGYLTIKGRKKNMILTSNGLNIYPEDVERVINEQAGIKESCVLGLKEKKDIVIVGVVLVHSGDSIDVKKLLSAVNERLQSHQRVSRILVWKGDFPRTPSLKVKRREVAAGLESNKKERTAPAEKEKLARVLTTLSSASLKRIRPEHVLATDLAIDSLHRVELVARIEEEYNVEIPEEAIGTTTTVKELDALIKKGESFHDKAGLTWLNTSRWVWPLRASLQAVLFGFVYLFVKVRPIGNKNLPQEPTLYVMNHTSHLDTVAFLRSLPWKIRSHTAIAAAKDYFFEGGWLKRKLFVPFLRLLLNVYPFARTTGIRQSIKDTGTLFDHGYNVLIFPEGTRTITGKMSPFKAGVGVIAHALEAPVIPVYAKGLYALMPKGRSIPRRGKTSVHYGDEVEIDYLASYLKTAAKLELAVKRLGGEE